MTRTPTERHWGWLVGAILAPIAYGAAYELIDMARSPEGINAFAWHDFLILMALPAVIIAGGITGALWSHREWAAGALPWTVVLVGLLVGSFPGWAFQYGTFVDLTLGLVLAGSWLLVKRQGALEDLTVGLGATAAVAHLVVGVGLQLAARPTLARMDPARGLPLRWTLGVVVLLATGMAAVIWWREHQAGSPGAVLLVWLALGVVGLLTHPGGLPVDSMRAGALFQPAPDYLKGALVLPWLMVLAAQADQLVDWSLPTRASTTE